MYLSEKEFDKAVKNLRKAYVTAVNGEKKKYQLANQLRIMLAQLEKIRRKNIQSLDLK